MDELRNAHYSWAHPSKHSPFSGRKRTCRYCKPAIEYVNDVELRTHYERSHMDVYCGFCAKHFGTGKETDEHMFDHHAKCYLCFRYCLDLDGLADHIALDHPTPTTSQGYRRRGNPKPKTPPRQSRKSQTNVTDHYTTLGISAQASHEEVLQAAKSARINSHPDRLKRQEGLTGEQKRKIEAEAALVGQAADVLCDPDLRSKYDRGNHW